jgi:hypothetical protein
MAQTLQAFRASFMHNSGSKIARLRVENEF